MSHSVRVFPSREALAQSFAAMLIRDLDRIEPDHYYTIALSGGSTPEFIFRYLSENYAERISWEKLLVFWGDERCVLPEDKESNYRMAYESLLQNVPIPDANIFRIKGEDDPVTEARQYSELVSSMVPFYNGIPQFDLMLLGLGDDGHTASIFPDRIDLFATGQLFEVAVKPDTRQKRITATGKIINNSSKIYYIVTGKGKASIVSEIIEGKRGSELYPASRVMPASGHLVWMLDVPAASLLRV
ncbi:MAG: 6-phosphogluconolactonase [Bacteroidetes bacterium]|nr:MAG: 6-phosphogluconolactonase [Bacteroidota bacterium]